MTAELHQELLRAAGLHQAGQLSAAMQIYRQILQIDPSRADAWHLLGVASAQSGDTVTALQMIDRAIAIAPRVGSYHGNRGMVLLQAGRPSEAEASQRQALQIDPRSIEAHRNLGKALADQCRWKEAEAAYRDAIRLNDRSADVYCSLGISLKEQRRYDEALAAYHSAIQIDSRSAAAYNNLGNLLKLLGRYGEASDCCQRAVELQPQLAEGYNNLGNALADQGRLDEALAAYERAVALKPDFALAHSNLLLTQQYRADVTIERLNESHTQWNTQHAAALSQHIVAHRNGRDPERRLRLGFVSADLWRHPIGYLLLPVFQGLDRKRCEVFVYANQVRRDEVTLELSQSVDTWHDVAAWNDERLAEQIRHDQIDILFDLSGHTAENRLLMFARKPAPIQISWLGYVGPTGVEAIDYFLTDGVLVSDELVARYAQQPLRFAHAPWCTYRLPLDAPEVGPLPALEHGFVTFGSFNKPTKITPQVVTLWANILQRVPRSRLVLKYRGFNDPPTRERYLRLFEAAGVDPQRLACQGESPFRDMLDQYQAEIDLALDPFPHNGGMTTILALWMGVPVVTWPGETLASRQSYATYRAMNWTEAVARNQDEYVELAVALANDWPRLAAWRAELRPRLVASSMMNGPALAVDLLDEIRTVWRAWCAGDQ